VIVAHHAGEEVLLLAAVNGSAAVSVALVVWRARIRRLVTRLWRRK
jgi:hypothetical protein